MTLPNDESGRVRVLSAASVRHLKIPYLFLAGLSERSFPAAESDDGVYSQAERQRLIEAGLPLPSRGDRQSEEMLLFYEAINAATRRLWLSYPAVDEKGEPLDCQSLCEGGRAGLRRDGHCATGRIDSESRFRMPPMCARWTPFASAPRPTRWTASPICLPAS